MNKLVFEDCSGLGLLCCNRVSNTDGIRDEIGSLRDRGIALEAKIGSVNTSRSYACR